MFRSFLFCFAFLFFLTGCEQVNELLGLEDLAQKEARLEADGKAVGGGCRQSGRALEDCYAIYSWLPRAAVYAGWRDMDAYMRENNIETIEPQLPPVEPPGVRRRVSVDSETDQTHSKPKVAKTSKASGLKGEAEEVSAQEDTEATPAEKVPEKVPEKPGAVQEKKR